MNEIIRKAEIRMYLTSVIGSIGVLVMAILEYTAGNFLISVISLVLSAVVIINAILYLFHKKLKITSYVIGSVGAIVALLATVWGGFEKTGWMVVMIFVPLAFGTFKLKKGILAVTLLSITIMAMVAWGYYANWELGYSLQEYAILAFAYIVLAVITGAAQWEQDKTLEHERKNNLIIVKQERDLLKFEAVAKQSVEMMVFTDPEGIVLWANEAAETITGFTIEEAINRKAGVLWGKLMPKEWYQKMWQTIKTEKKTFHAEIENHRKNGEHFFSTITIYPLLNKTGEVEFFVATQRDVTKEKVIDQMKTDFISLASHQLRTPLSSMRWNLEMLLSSDMGKLAPKQKRVVENIYNSNKNMIELVALLLNVSRLEAGKIEVKHEKLAARNLLKESLVDSMTKLKRRKQTIEIEIEKSIKEMTTDKAMFAQILTNLVNNAVKYSPEGGVIKVAVKREGENYKLSVKDSGIGIPEQDKTKVFGKYFRGSNAVKVDAGGTGLGLYLCKIIASSLGGEMGYESKEGSGSTFWFTLPINNAKHKEEGKLI